MGDPSGYRYHCLELALAPQGQLRQTIIRNGRVQPGG